MWIEMVKTILRIIYYLIAHSLNRGLWIDYTFCLTRFNGFLIYCRCHWQYVS